MKARPSLRSTLYSVYRVRLEDIRPNDNRLKEAILIFTIRPNAICFKEHNKMYTRDCNILYWTNSGDYLDLVSFNADRLILPQQYDQEYDPLIAYSFIFTVLSFLSVDVLL